MRLVDYAKAAGIDPDELRQFIRGLWHERQKRIMKIDRKVYIGAHTERKKKTYHYHYVPQSELSEEEREERRRLWRERRKAA